MSKPYQITLTREGEFVKASFECLLCDTYITTTNSTHAMMSICGVCAQTQANNTEVMRIIADGVLHRAHAFTNATKQGRGEP